MGVISLLTLVMLNILGNTKLPISCSIPVAMAPDQVASSEASCSGSTVFSKKDISGFSRIRVNRNSSCVWKSMDPDHGSTPSGVWV